MFRDGEFRDGYGRDREVRPIPEGRPAAAGIRLGLRWPEPSSSAARTPSPACSTPSIDTIIEVGYARASAKVIAQRAQVSDGALFRHFPTMGDFMAATAHEAAGVSFDWACQADRRPSARRQASLEAC